MNLREVRDAARELLGVPHYTPVYFIPGSAPPKLEEQPGRARSEKIRVGIDWAWHART